MERVCPVVQYNVNYREEKGHWNSITVSGNTTTYTLHLECWKEYEVTVTCCDKEDSKIWNFKTGTKGKGLCLTLVPVTPRSTYGYSVPSPRWGTFIFGQKS